MTAREREFVAALCEARAGLKIEAHRGYLLEQRLGGLARRQGYSSVSDLIHAARARAEEELLWAMVEALVPAQTAFFRDPDVFEDIGQDLARLAGCGPLKIWSAACGSGQEAYALAMLLDEHGVAGAELLASDLAEHLLETGRRGLYSPFEVQQGLSAHRLVRHFQNHDDAFAIAPPLRRRVRWRRMNLLDAPGPVGEFDLILCRYVLGSLTAEARSRILAGLAAALRPGGRLILSPGDLVPAELGLMPAPGRRGAYDLAHRVRAAA